MKIPSFPRAIARACARIALPGVALLFSAFCAAAPITIPNATFSDPANNGQIGGGLIGGSGSGPISSGPWGGAYFGVVGVLAPPALTISSGRATVSGLAGVDLLGIVNNGGDFDQLLTTAYAPNHHYVLNADVDGGHVIDAGVLNSGNAGIALFSGSAVLASSIDNPNATLVWIGGTTYRLTLTYDSGATAGGNIGVQLFAHPQNLTTSNLLTSISFGNVTRSIRCLPASRPQAAHRKARQSTPRSLRRSSLA